MKKYNQFDWEISVLFDRYPNGCGKECYCTSPADDCGCEDCQKRHTYRVYYSPMLKSFKDYRLN
ncbi:hypothetical protein [Pedobacter heparinus]|uniref:hypothetical protein n=1 Tax=Pedobacter heparinus TaxID=984 RepID=UPI002931BC8A|nr:hypothetical protein [Pedobacter heparinus]